MNLVQVTAFILLAGVLSACASSGMSTSYQAELPLEGKLIFKD